MSKTCPNCGAPISGWQCDYCGAAFYDFSSLDISFEKPIFFKFRDSRSGKVFQTSVRLTEMNMDSTPVYTICNGMYMGHAVRASMQRTIGINFDVVGDLIEMEGKNDG